MLENKLLFVCLIQISFHYIPKIIKYTIRQKLRFGYVNETLSSGIKRLVTLGHNTLIKHMAFFKTLTAAI